MRLRIPASPPASSRRSRKVHFDDASAGSARLSQFYSAPGHTAPKPPSLLSRDEAAAATATVERQWRQLIRPNGSLYYAFTHDSITITTDTRLHGADASHTALPDPLLGILHVMRTSGVQFDVHINADQTYIWIDHAAHIASEPDQRLADFRKMPRSVEPSFAVITGIVASGSSTSLTVRQTCRDPSDTGHMCRVTRST